MEFELADEMISFYGTPAERSQVKFSDMQTSVCTYKSIVINSTVALHLRKKAIARLIWIPSGGYEFEEEDIFADTQNRFLESIADTLSDLTSRFISSLVFSIHDVSQLSPNLQLTETLIKREYAHLQKTVDIVRCFSNIYFGIDGLHDFSKVVLGIPGYDEEDVFESPSPYFYSEVKKEVFSNTGLIPSNVKPEVVGALRCIKSMAEEHLESSLSTSEDGPEVTAEDRSMAIRECIIIITLMSRLRDRTRVFNDLLLKFSSAQCYTNQIYCGVLPSLIVSSVVDGTLHHDFNNLRSTITFSYFPCPITLELDTLLVLSKRALETVDKSSVVVLNTIMSFGCELHGTEALSDLPVRVLERGNDESIPEVLRQDLLDFTLRYGTPAQIDQAYLGLANLTEHKLVYNVYEDKQNVHKVALTPESHAFLIELFKTTFETESSFSSTINDGETNIERLNRVLDLGDSTPSEELRRIKTSMNRIVVDFATFDFKHGDDKILITANQLLSMILHHIENDPEDSEIRNRLRDELLDMAHTCSSGHFRRLCNVFSDRGIQFTITWEDQVHSNVKARFWAAIKKNEVPFAPSLIETGKLDTAYTDEFDRLMKKIYETLQYEFMEYISSTAFDTHYAKALSALTANIS